MFSANVCLICVAITWRFFLPGHISGIVIDLQKVLLIPAKEIPQRAIACSIIL